MNIKYTLIHSLHVNNSKFCHPIKWRGSPPLTRTFFHFTAIFTQNFLKPTLFSFGYYYASARIVASQLNHQIILLLKRPLTHY